MTRASGTIDLGIDLGTTNSVVAVLRGINSEPLQDSDGTSFLTPSAVYIDKRGTVYIGNRAKQALRGDESDNVATEFKLGMGKGQSAAMVFPNTGKRLVPEELSALVLKELRTAAGQNLDHDVLEAVITVPADFDLPECDATRRAAELAGLRSSPLLQEPVAAALAYGFQDHDRRSYWLVYDFGGGTFDAAVIQVRDGVIQVVNHDGDKNLGGKNIDERIISELILPQLQDDYSLDRLARGQDAVAHAMLKSEVEAAKIRLCRTKRAQPIYIEHLCDDDRGKAVEVNVTLEPTAFAEMVQPFARRTVDLCRRALSHKDLTPQDLDRVIVAGGSSLIPWVREVVESELGTTLSHDIDPLTVVARGAAIFAGTQKSTLGAGVPAKVGTWALELDYDAIGYDAEFPIGGRIAAADGKSPEGFTIEFSELQSQWRSGRITLSPEGGFVADVRAEPGRRNVYSAQLLDGGGTQQAIEPAEFSYTVGATIQAQMLAHDIGVGDAMNRFRRILEKGTELPSRGSDDYKTTRALSRGESAKIEIPILQGTDRTKADRNRRIGQITISAAGLRRDLPMGSAVEVTLSVDDPGSVKATAYVPMLDEEFDAVVDLGKTARALEDIDSDLAAERQRLADLTDRAEELEDEQAGAAVQQIERQETVERLSERRARAESSEGERVALDEELQELRKQVDAIEDAVEWPQLVTRAREEASECQRMVDDYGTEEEEARCAHLTRRIDECIGDRDSARLRRAVDEVSELNAAVTLRQPGFWVGWLQYLEENRHQMSDSAMADQLFDRGQRAIQEGEFDTLRSVVQQLVGLLPKDLRQSPTGYASDIL